MYSQQAELLPVSSVKFPLRLEDKSDVMVTRHVIQDLCLIPDKGKGGCLRYCAGWNQSVLPSGDISSVCIASSLCR